MTVKLDPFQGCWVFFCTQLPTDLPNDVLPAGTRIQHAPRAYPITRRRARPRTLLKTDVYDLESALTSLGTGEAVVTASIGEVGAPTPVAWTRMRRHGRRWPRSEPKRSAAFRQPVAGRMAASIDRPSAHEILSAKLRRQRGPGYPGGLSPAGQYDSPPWPDDFEVRRCPLRWEPQAPRCGRRYSRTGPSRASSTPPHAITYWHLRHRAPPPEVMPSCPQASVKAIPRLCHDGARSGWRPPTSPLTSDPERRASCCAPRHSASYPGGVLRRDPGSPAPADQ